jgi:hypothetical protein
MSTLTKSVLETEYRSQILNSLKLSLSYEEMALAEKYIDTALEEHRDVVSLTLFNNYKNTSSKFTAPDLIDKILEGKMVMTGNGLLLKKQNKAKSAIADLADYLLNMRSIDKGLMLKYLNTNPALSNIYKNRQLVDKLLANSLYGVMAEKNSIFYNLFTAEGITKTGRVIIGSVTVAFEKFLGNPHYTSFSVFSIAIAKQVAEYTPSVQAAIKKNKLYDSVTDIKKKLEVKYMNSINIRNFSLLEVEAIRDMVQGFSDDLACFLYYKNNFYEFIKLPLLKPILSRLAKIDLLKIEGYINAEPGSDVSSELDKDAHSDLEKLWKLSTTLVADYYFESDTASKIEVMPRKSVLLVDTDSNFLYLDPFLQIVNTILGNSKTQTMEEKISIINILTFLSVRFVKKVLYTLTTNMFVQEEFKKEVKMKSEYFFTRVILTSNKKQYASKIVYQEGVMLQKPKISLTGLQIKKSHFSKHTRDYFKKLIEEEFFEPNIETLKILSSIYEFQKSIVVGIKNGSLEFAENKQFNSKDQYKEAGQIPVYRAATVWNTIFPEDPILFGEKCFLYRTTLEDPKQLKELHATNPELAKKIYKAVWKTHPEIAKYGMTYLGFPKTLSKIPDWAIPFIDTESVVISNTTPGMVLLESLGVSTFIKKNKKYFTNIVNI